MPPPTTPPPEYRQHLLIEEGDLSPGATVSAGTPGTVRIPVHASYRFRARIKADAAGALNASLVRAPNSVDDASGLDDLGTYSTGNPDEVTVAADTEAMIELTDLTGEAYVEVSYEPDSGDGVIDYLEVCQV